MDGTQLPSGRRRRGRARGGGGRRSTSQRPGVRFDRRTAASRHVRRYRGQRVYACAQEALSLLDPFSSKMRLSALGFSGFLWTRQGLQYSGRFCRVRNAVETEVCHKLLADHRGGNTTQIYSVVGNCCSYLTSQTGRVVPFDLKRRDLLGGRQNL